MKVRSTKTWDAERFNGGDYTNISQFMGNSYEYRQFDKGHSSEVLHVYRENDLVMRLYPGDLVIKIYERLEVVRRSHIGIDYEIVPGTIDNTQPTDVDGVPARFLKIQ